MRSRIEIMGFTMPAPPIPHHPLHVQGYGQVVRDVPGAGGEPCPPRQGTILLCWRA